MVFDKSRVVARVQEIVSATTDLDCAEAIGALYAAAQLLERVALERRLLSLEELTALQIMGKRLGAGLRGLEAKDAN